MNKLTRKLRNTLSRAEAGTSYAFSGGGLMVAVLVVVLLVLLLR